MKAEGRWGYSTGACAAAAAKAAARAALGLPFQPQERIPFPDGRQETLPIAWARNLDPGAEAAVLKDAGDDPDVTHGACVEVRLTWLQDTPIRFEAGEGVGTVTRPGFQVPVGDPAINPGPRRMIEAALRELTSRGATVRISIPGGAALAQRTFNPRLGVVGGLSILGTAGRVRPFSLEAIKATIDLALNVAWAEGHRTLAAVPGHIGARSAQTLHGLSETQLLEVSNEWGYALDRAAQKGFHRLLLVGHPGKLAKLGMGHFDTHSARSPSPVPSVADLALQLTGQDLRHLPTVEGLFQALDPAPRLALGQALASQIKAAAEARSGRPCAVTLCAMNGALLGEAL